MSKLRHVQEYTQHIEANDTVKKWVDSVLKNYLEKHQVETSEVEHILDYLHQRTKPFERMSYEEACSEAEKWTKTLQKKAAHIKEEPGDVEVVLDFKDGFKIVKLVGKAAYEREGYLMRHCSASYYGKDVEVYSLRDENNMPHCTMEKDRQVKGKGNGDIHPKYVGYVVRFLEHVGMHVGDSEMLHLGYINLEDFRSELSEKTEYFNEKYVPKTAELKDKNGNEWFSPQLLSIIPLISKAGESIKVNFDIPFVARASFEWIKNNINSSATSGNDAHSATSGEYAHSATSGEYANSATSGEYAHSATSGNRAHSATSGEYAHSATSGNDAHSATSGEYAHSATSGNRANSATSGYGAHSATSGNDAIACAINRKAKAKASLGCWIVLAEWEEGEKYTDAKPIAIKSAKVDGKKIKADQWYKLEGGKFVETDDSNE